MMDFRALVIMTTLLTWGSVSVSGNTGELSATTGDTILIPCVFGEGTIRNLYWYFNDGTGTIMILKLFEGNVSVDTAYANRASLHDDSSTLILTDIIVKDEGTYRCDVDREGQTAVPNINTKLDVYSLTPDTLPEIVECTYVDCIIYSSKSITITCALRNVYPVEDVKLIWYQDEQLVTSPNNLTLNEDGTIDLIRPIQVSDSGNFTCNAFFLTTQGAENAAVSVAVWITPESENTPGKKLTSGQTAGIVVCALTVPLLVFALLIVRKRQRRKNKDSNVAVTVPLITSVNRSGVVEDPKLILLASYFPVGKFHEFCLQLDWEYNDANQVLIKHSSDCEKALLEILITWKTRTGGHRSVLQNALLEAGVGGLLPLIAGEKTEIHPVQETTNDAGPKEEQCSLIQGLDKTTYSSSLPTVPNPKQESSMDRSGRREVTSEEITRLVRMVPESKFGELFNALGCDYNYHTKILKKHIQDISAAAEVLLELWKGKTHGYTDVLDEAMKKAKVGELIPKYKQVLEGSSPTTTATASTPSSTSTTTFGSTSISTATSTTTGVLPTTTAAAGVAASVDTVAPPNAAASSRPAFGFDSAAAATTTTTSAASTTSIASTNAGGDNQSQLNINGNTKSDRGQQHATTPMSSPNMSAETSKNGRQPTDEEITELSRTLPHSKYKKFCGILGIEFNKHETILMREKKDYAKAYEILLQEWNDGAQPIKDLDAALEKAELASLIPRYKKRQPTDEEITELSRILPHSKYIKFCEILGFKFNKHETILMREKRDYAKAYKIRLQEWNDGTKTINDLDAALEEAELARLIPLYTKSIVFKL